MTVWILIDLFNKVALKGDVLAGLVRDGQGNNVAQPLWLVDDGVSERQVLPILHSDLSASHHPGQLLLDLVWVQGNKEGFWCDGKQDAYPQTSMSESSCTLKTRELGHVEQTPLECECRCVCSRCKQVHQTVEQVVLVVVRVLHFRFLTRQETRGVRQPVVLYDVGKSRILTSTFSWRFRKTSTKHLHDEGSQLLSRSAMMFLLSSMRISRFLIKILQFLRKGPIHGNTLYICDKEQVKYLYNRSAQNLMRSWCTFVFAWFMMIHLTNTHFHYIYLYF